MAVIHEVGEVMNGNEQHKVCECETEEV